MSTVRATVRGSDDVFFEFTEILRGRNRKAKKDLAAILQKYVLISMTCFYKDTTIDVTYCVITL